MYNFIEILPKEILKKCIKLSFDDGLTGYAFYANEMLEIANIIKNNNLIILGGNVLKQTENGIKYFIPNSWSIDYNNNKNYNIIVKKSIEKMIEYVNDINKKIPKLLYQVVLADEDNWKRINKEK